MLLAILALAFGGALALVLPNGTSQGRAPGAVQRPADAQRPQAGPRCCAGLLRF